MIYPQGNFTRNYMYGQLAEKKAPVSGKDRPIPKSDSSKSPLTSTRMFVGFRSLCKILGSLACNALNKPSDVSSFEHGNLLCSRLVP